VQPPRCRKSTPLILCQSLLHSWFRYACTACHHAFLIAVYLWSLHLIMMAPIPVPVEACSEFYYVYWPTTSPPTNPLSLLLPLLLKGLGPLPCSCLLRLTACPLPVCFICMCQCGPLSSPPSTQTSASSSSPKQVICHASAALAAKGVHCSWHCVVCCSCCVCVVSTVSQESFLITSLVSSSSLIQKSAQ
jgi:hypothetical protein